MQNIFIPLLHKGQPSKLKMLLFFLWVNITFKYKTDKFRQFFMSLPDFMYKNVRYNITLSEVKLHRKKYVCWL